MGERRTFTRIPFDATVHLVSADGSWYTRLIDVSLKGVLAERPQNWDTTLGARFLVELVLDDSDVVISMETAVAHIEDHQVGFQCHHVSLEGMAHLRRLVELNLAHEGLLDRELSALINPRP